MNVRLLGNPVKISLAALFNGQSDYFGAFIGMQSFDACVQFKKASLLGLDNQEVLVVLTYFALPSVDGANTRCDIDTGCQSLFDKGARDEQALFLGGGRDQYYDGIGHRFTL